LAAIHSSRKTKGWWFHNNWKFVVIAGNSNTDSSTDTAGCWVLVLEFDDLAIIRISRTLLGSDSFEPKDEGVVVLVVPQQLEIRRHRRQLQHRFFN
jgi:hypothetical protein